MKILTVDGIAREVMWSLKRWRDATLKTDEDSDDDQIIIDDDEDEEHVDAEDLDDNNFPRSAAMSDPRLKELHKYSACDVSLFFFPLSLLLFCATRILWPKKEDNVCMHMSCVHIQDLICGRMSGNVLMIRACGPTVVVASIE